MTSDGIQTAPPVATADSQGGLPPPSPTMTRRPSFKKLKKRGKSEAMVKKMHSLRNLLAKRPSMHKLFRHSKSSPDLFSVNTADTVNCEGEASPPRPVGETRPKMVTIGIQTAESNDGEDDGSVPEPQAQAAGGGGEQSLVAQVTALKIETAAAAAASAGGDKNEDSICPSLARSDDHSLHDHTVSTLGGDDVPTTPTSTREVLMIPQQFTTSPRQFYTNPNMFNARDVVTPESCKKTLSMEGKKWIELDGKWVRNPEWEG